METILEYDYDVVYKKGSQNVVADALSRITGEINTNSVLLPQIVPLLI